MRGASGDRVEPKESRTASGVVVALALTFLIAMIVTLTSGTAIAAPTDGMTIPNGIIR